MIGYNLSIDFGTSNTMASVHRPGQPPRVLRLTARTDAMPSGVLLLNGEMRVGVEAQRLAGGRPSAFERTPKRRLLEPSIPLGGAVVQPPELVAGVLRHVVHTAVAQNNGEWPQTVILTHPQAWPPHRRDLLAVAAEGAGIPRDRQALVAEPIAAAFHYQDVTEWRPGDRLAIVDFGGGTFDVSLVQAVTGPAGVSFQVIDADGIERLGGDDFDASLLDWALEQASRTHPALARRLWGNEPSSDLLNLRDEVRLAKEALSEHYSTTVRVQSGHEQVEVALARETFEALIGPSVERTAELTRALLARNRVTASQLRQVFLTGGSSHIPLIRNTFEQLAGHRVGQFDDPKAVTALGAHRAPPSSAGTSDLLPEPDLHSQVRRPGSPVWLWVTLVTIGVAILGTVGAVGIPLLTGRLSSMSSSPTSTSRPATTTTRPATTTASFSCSLAADECAAVTAVGELVDPTTCTTGRRTDEYALIQCSLPPADGLEERAQASVKKFPSAEAAEAHFANWTEGITEGDDLTKPPIKRVNFDSNRWEAATYYAEGGQPTVVWLDRSTSTFGLLESSDRNDLEAVVQWWYDH